LAKTPESGKSHNIKELLKIILWQDLQNLQDKNQIKSGKPCISCQKNVVAKGF
jgi:hypothetical protein